jgi:hypothetical protein
VALDGQHFRLTSITPRAGPEPVFNLEVANQHVYFVSEEGLLVHNAMGPVYLTEKAKGKSKRGHSTYLAFWACLVAEGRIPSQVFWRLMLAIEYYQRERHGQDCAVLN